MELAQTPVASIVQVGANAIVGDVVVAVAVVTEDIAGKLKLRSTPKADDHINIDVLDAESGAYQFAIRSTPNATDGSIQFFLEDWNLGQQDALGRVYSEYSKLVAFSKAVGFCPTSETDLFQRLANAEDVLFRLVHKNYPNIPVFMPAISALIDTKALWHADGFPKFPTPLGPVSCRTVGTYPELADAGAIRAIIATIAAEVIAASVRTARIYDLDEKYPSLSLSSNLGYSCSSLFKGFARFPFSTTSPGFRGDITDAWIAKTEQTTRGSKIDPKSISTSQPSGAGKDSSGRTMPFDAGRATQMTADLNAKLTAVAGNRWDQWTKDFVQSITAQLQEGKRLTGRQMKVLHQVHEKRGR
jgi:ribonuclease HII